MRDYRDAKAMARSLRENLKSKSVDLSHSESLELVAKALGFRDWNVLSARIDGGPAAPEPAESGPAMSAPPERRCSFCGKANDEVKRLIAGPAAFICDACVGRCETVLRGGSPAADDGLPASKAEARKQIQRLREFRDLLATAGSASAAAPGGNDGRAAIVESIRAMTPERRQAQSAEISRRIAEIEGALDRLS